MKIGLFVVVVLAAWKTQAFQGLLETQKTSDRIYLESLSISKTFAESQISLEGLTQNMEFRNDNKSHLQLHKALLGRKFQWNELTNFSVLAGALQFKDEGVLETQAVGRLEVSAQGEKVQWSLVSERLSLSEGLRSTGFVGYTVMEWRNSMNVRWRLSKKWRTSAQVTQSYFDDSNSSQSYDIQALYGISESWPWIWLGYGANGLHFERTQSGYWSPQNFYNHGPRLDASFPIYQQISGVLAFNSNFFNENGTSGEGYLVAAGIQWGPFDGTNVRLLYSKIRSGQNQTPWIYEGLRLTCQILSF